MQIEKMELLDNPNEFNVILQENYKLYHMKFIWQAPLIESEEQQFSKTNNVVWADSSVGVVPPQEVIKNAIQQLNFFTDNQLKLQIFKAVMQRLIEMFDLPIDMQINSLPNRELVTLYFVRTLMAEDVKELVETLMDAPVVVEEIKLVEEVEEDEEESEVIVNFGEIPLTKEEVYKDLDEPLFLIEVAGENA